MADYLSFQNIYEAVQRIGGDESGAWTDKVKNVVNMVYLDEILVCDDLYPMHWLMELVDGIKTKVSATITGVTKANPGVVTATAHGFVNGDVVQHGVITGMAELNYVIAVVTNKAANTYDLYDLNGDKIDTSGYAAVGTAGTAYHRGVTLSKSIAKVHSFSWQGYDGQIDPIGLREIEESASLMDTANSSRPTRHSHKQHFTTAGVKSDRVLWYPLPNGVYDGRVWGELDISPMSDAAHVPQLPFRFHNAIISGSVARLVQYGQVQIENAVIWPGLYKAQLEAIKTYNRKWWKQFVRDERSSIYLI
jgi:hypothetical protein